MLILTTEEELPRTELARLVSRLFFLRVSTSTLWESVTYKVWWHLDNKADFVCFINNNNSWPGNITRNQQVLEGKVIVLPCHQLSSPWPVPLPSPGNHSLFSVHITRLITHPRHAAEAEN